MRRCYYLFFHVQGKSSALSCAVSFWWWLLLSSTALTNEFYGFSPVSNLSTATLRDFPENESKQKSSLNILRKILRVVDQHHIINSIHRYLYAGRNFIHYELLINNNEWLRNIRYTKKFLFLSFRISTAWFAECIDDRSRIMDAVYGSTDMFEISVFIWPLYSVFSVMYDVAHYFCRHFEKRESFLPVSLFLSI